MGGADWSVLIFSSVVYMNKSLIILNGGNEKLSRLGYIVGQKRIITDKFGHKFGQCS